MDLIELKQVQKNFKRHPWEEVRLKVLFFFLKKVVPQHKVIADIGSGDAFISKSLAHEFPESSISAVDVHYTPEIKETLKEDDLPNISFTSNLYSIEKHPSPKVDLIVLMDVLEHIEKPEQFLNEIKNLNKVTAATHFFITVPAYQFLFTRHDTILGHHKRYTRKGLNQLLLSQGMQIQFSGYFFCSLVLVRVLQKIFNTDFSNEGLHNWRSGNGVTSLVTGIFWLEFKISWYLSRLGISVPGLTCYCLCRPLPS